MKTEIEYFIKELDPKRTSVAKFINNDFAKIYVQENSQCDCPGALYHKRQCRHMAIKTLWLKLNKPVGYFTINPKKGEPTFHPINQESTSNAS